MSLEPCPHCGELVEETASRCPHCGSDAETGWLDEGEIDYQSLDLPGEEHDLEGREDLESLGDPGGRKILGSAALLGFLILFTSLGFQVYGTGVLLPAVILAVLSVVFLRVLPRRGRR